LFEGAVKLEIGCAPMGAIGALLEKDCIEKFLESARYLWYSKKIVQETWSDSMKVSVRRSLASLLVFSLLVVAGSTWAAEDKVAFLSGKLRETSSFKVRLKAAVLLGRLADPRAVKPLSEALDDENYVVRGAAARALGNLGHPAAVSAVEPLLSLVDDEEQFVRKEAGRALQRLAGEKSLDYFISALSNENAGIRLAAVHVLSTMKMAQARAAIIPVLGDSDEEVRAEAIVAFKGLGLAELADLLNTALGSQDNYKVQATAARLVGELKISALLGKLADLLVRDDVVPEVKREATESLSQMKGEIDVERALSELAPENRSLRDRAIKLLGIQGGRKAVDALMALLKDPDAFLRRRAIIALGDAGDPRAISSLEYLLKTEETPRLREQIKRTLRKLKP